MRIRPATEADRDAIVTLWHALLALHRPYDAIFTEAEDAEAIWRDHLAYLIQAERTSLLLVAEQAGTIVGYLIAVVERHPPVLAERTYGTITDIMVTPAARRHRVGARLVREALRWFRQRAIRRVELQVAARNRAGRAFWRAQGFRDYMQRLARELE